ncbi:MAG: hypothetical protein INH43_12615 [Acidobacteriaceae bacterium]|jgi:hypothetical protein|nr:hypothetical protein [Acidobacteriaceae bacterium]
MRFRWQNWMAAFILVAACVGVGGGVVWYRSRLLPTLAERMERLPAGASALYLDLASMRQTGLLALLSGQNVTEDPDYTAFVASTGFDYRADLDSALIGWAGADVYILATGRFDWKAIQAHTVRSGGRCWNGVCRMRASTPSRMVSFAPLTNGMIGMAVSTDEWAVVKLQNKAPNRLAAPDAVVWAGGLGRNWRESESLPAGTRLFAKALGEAEVVTLGLHAGTAGAEVRLRAECANESAAGGVESQLRGVTEVFRKYLENVQQRPNPEDLSGILTSGTFAREGTVVTGRWPVQRPFLEKLLSGQL